MSVANDVSIAMPPPPNLRVRKLRSLVWNDFTKEQKPDGTMVAICNHCQKQLTASSRSGTTHLRNHLSICANTTTQQADRPDRRKRRKLIVHRPLQISYEVKNDKAANFENSHFDQEVSRQDLARMIILHGYPLSMVHHSGFQTFVRNLQPQFKLVHQEVVKVDCMNIYEELRNKIFDVLDKLPCRVSLTADSWRSVVSEEEEYLCLTCHYIDNEWKLQKKALNFLHFDTSPSGEEISETVMEKLNSWRLTKKLSTMIVDNCTHTEELTGYMLKFGRTKASLLNGDLFHVRGYAHVLDLVVQDGLEVISDIVDRIRDVIKYLKSSEEAMRKFQKLARFVQAPEKSLLLDNKSNWKSTLSMLASACEFEVAFCHLAESDAQFCNLLPTDFTEVKAICDCLDLFYNAIEKISDTKFPTANLYFNDACGIRLLLKDWSANPLSAVATIASEMLYKFEQYWDVTGKVMAIASVLDPRYKMKSIEYFFKLIYNGEYEAKTKTEHIHKILTSLYNEYYVRSAYTSNNHSLLLGYDVRSGGRNNGVGTSEGGLKSSRITLSDTQRGLDQYLQQSSSDQSLKSDLDVYLEEAVHPLKEGHGDNFDVLGWWKFNEAKYPILSLVARDVLAIPISVPLDNKDRLVNQYLSSMDGEIVEGLFCAKAWLRDEVAGDVDDNMGFVPANEDELVPLNQ